MKHPNYHDAGHPIWPILRLAVLMLALVGVLWATANDFDETEEETIIWMFLAAGGIEGISKIFTTYRGGRQDE